MDTVDICFTEMLGEVLRRTGSFDNIIVLPLIFNIGNVDDIENLLVNNFLDDSNEKKQSLANDLKYCKKEIFNFNYFRIWYSETSLEYCGLIYIIHLLNSLYNPNISVINTTQNYNTGNTIISYKSSKEIPEERISFFLSKQQVLTNDLRQKYLNEYYEFFNCKFRVIKNGKLSSITERECKNIFLSLIKKPKVHIFNLLTKIIYESLLDDENIAKYIMLTLAKDNKIRITEEIIYFDENEKE